VLKEQRAHIINAIKLDKEDGRRHKGLKIMNAIKKMYDDDKQPKNNKHR